MWCISNWRLYSLTQMADCPIRPISHTVVSNKLERWLTAPTFKGAFRAVVPKSRRRLGNAILNFDLLNPWINQDSCISRIDRICLAMTKQQSVDTARIQVSVEYEAEGWRLLT